MYKMYNFVKEIECKEILLRYVYGKLIFLVQSQQRNSNFLLGNIPNCMFWILSGVAVLESFVIRFKKSTGTTRPIPTNYFNKKIIIQNAMFRKRGCALYINEQNLVCFVLLYASCQIGSYFANDWIGITFWKLPTIPLLGKSRTSSWQCSLVYIQYNSGTSRSLNNIFKIFQNHNTIFAPNCRVLHIN